MQTKLDRLDERTRRTVESALDALDDGFLVELMKLRDGTIKAKTVRKKEIVIPTVQ